MRIFSEFRSKEILVLMYRLFLVYFFYQIARFLFWYYNQDLMHVETIWEYLKLSYYGIAFDTTALLYINSLFILLSLVPAVVNTKGSYQKILFFVYFVTNGISYIMNFGDFIYYKFSQARLTIAAFDIAKNESNIAKVFWVSITEHPSVVLFYILLLYLWIRLYKVVKIVERKPKKMVPYFIWSVITLAAVVTLTIGGIRGDFKHSTRPINMVDANKHVNNPSQGNLVLNSIFSFIRTINSNSFKLVDYVDPNYIEENIHPFKIYDRKVSNKPNIVILIVESFSREYSGAFNEGKGIKDYVSYTPFVDSLAKHSLIFPNAFANGRQSIHGMSSILAGIPTLTDAFTSSPYSNQKIQSIVSICNDLGYDTSFYHGAPNGSMGFQGFGNILGFKSYMGKNEYNNDSDFDGMWAIWDEPFMQFFANTIGSTTPFMSTIFTASSHHPYVIPEKYKGMFKKGPLEIHQPMQYTDLALKRFFETAKAKSWYSNTIFVITGDHTNQIYYPEYEKTMNRYAIPILFFSPNPKYNLRGLNDEVTQQSDIYPTLVDLIGYNKKFRTWGRSLLSSNYSPSIVVNSNAINEQFFIGNYIYRFDGKDVVGLYKKEDLNMDSNLIGKEDNAEIRKGIMLCKAWYQDYMDRVVNRKLN